MNAMELIGRIAADRISEIVENERNGRVVYAIVDIPAEVTSAIALELAKLEHLGIQVAIHPDLATDDLPRRLVSTDVAMHFRNVRPEGTQATVFSVPPSEVEFAVQSLSDVERINAPWILDPSEADRWARKLLHSADPEMSTTLSILVRGLLTSEILASPKMLAEFLVEVGTQMTGPHGRTLPNAVNEALPKLRLARGMLDIKGDQRTYAKESAGHFGRALETVRQHFFLKSKNGEFRSISEMKRRIDEMEKAQTIGKDAANALRALVSDRGIVSGGWTESQARLAEIPWQSISPFFMENQKTAKLRLGEETQRILERTFPGTLTKKDYETLSEIRSETSSANPESEDFFTRHRERLRSEPKLYKRWERYVFAKPIESKDLMLGLLELAHSALKEDVIPDPVLYVVLRDSDKATFWETDKHTDLCRYLRDRFRGLGTLLGGHVVLNFGLCWKEDWENNYKEKVDKTGRQHVEFQFEAHVVPRSLVADGRIPKANELNGMRKAQMTWAPGARSFATAFSDDLRRMVSKEDGSAFLLTANVAQARHSRSGVLQSVRVDMVETITDVRGGNDGTLVGPDNPAFRIDQTWPTTLKSQNERKILTDAGRDALLVEFEAFRKSYTAAIRAFVSNDGLGLASPAVMQQANDYGALLRLLREHAQSDESVLNLWEPLLRIGVANVSGERQSMIVTPWHPLRLAEIGAKAKQCAEIIDRIVREAADEEQGVERNFVDDRISSLSVGYYADVGAIVGEQSLLVVETDRLADYSHLELPFPTDGGMLADEPSEEAVAAFGGIAEQYLRLRPHERSNFSVAIVDAESEDLPVRMANLLAQQIEDQADLRCDLVVTHEDQSKLRSIYERQNRRIGHEIDSSLTSETARTFLSRLRVGIVSSQAIDPALNTKSHDIVLLKDVIARTASVNWVQVPTPDTYPDIADHVPSDYSRRRPHRLGAVTTAVYLTAPNVPLPAHRYNDAVHDVLARRHSTAEGHRLPIQEVNFKSKDVAAKLARAHGLGNWVMTYDRIADRRLVAAEDRFRVLRYYSSPRSIHNVIVSTEISHQYVGERLRDDIVKLLPDATEEFHSTLMQAVHKRAASLSGGIVMRGAQWENSAKELIGVVVSQRQVDLLVSERGNHVTAWFFLDEFKRWLDISGEISDVLAVSLLVDERGPKVVINVVEAKCVGSDARAAESTKSMRQLETTYAAIADRFLTRKNEIDAAIWRGRLADMLLEHIDPFEHVGSVDYDDWLSGVRNGSLPMEVSGHSVVLVHDMQLTGNKDPLLPDLGLEASKRRRIAQWTFGRDVISRTMREYEASDAKSVLRIPREWPEQLPVEMIPAVSAEVPAALDASSVAIGIDEPRALQSGSRAGFEEAGAQPVPPVAGSIPETWLPAVWECINAMAPTDVDDDGEQWLEEQVAALKSAFQAEGADCPVVDRKLTPNSGIVYLNGRAVSTSWVERKQVDFMTRYSIEIIRIIPMPGRIGIALKRPKREILHLSQSWMRRAFEASAPHMNMSPLIGEREDDGNLFYMPLVGGFGDQEKAAPHTVISGTSGSGKGILATNLLLDLCAFNDPNNLVLHVIDPKRGLDYNWVRMMPHLRGGIVEERDAAITFFEELVTEMEQRYERLKEAGVNNIDQFARKRGNWSEMPRIIVFFDEVPNFMQDDEFKSRVEPLINEIATKSRASGIHLVMIYQRADNLVMTMQLRTNLGNKLVLRLGDEGSSRIVMNEKGAERLLGKGHVIAKLDSDEKIYGQVPYINEDEVERLAAVISASWAKGLGARGALAAAGYGQ